MGIAIALFVFLFCLYKLIFGGESTKEIVYDNEIIFKSSFSRGGSLIVPQKLIFTKTKVTLVTNGGVDDFYTTTSTHSIPFNKIVGIKVNRYVVGCDILIIGDGVQNIFAKSFTGEQADKIEKIVNYILEN